MDLYGEKHHSAPQKIVIHILEIAFLSLSFWLLFGSGGAWFGHLLGIENASNASSRRIILFLFHLITFLRLGFMMVVLLKRRIPWEESFSVPIAFALYYVGFTLLTLPSSLALDAWDLVGIGVFIFGGILNTGGEYLRHLWKKDPENKGKLYTGGFFKYSRHVNYLGDLLWVGGYAILSRNYWSFLIVVLLFSFFVFYNAPKLDRYLKEKYGEQYDHYAKKTRMLIPFIL